MKLSELYRDVEFCPHSTGLVDSCKECPFWTRVSENSCEYVYEDFVDLMFDEFISCLEIKDKKGE